MRREKKFINLSEVEKFLPLLIECAYNKNYMGRMMIARSIQPFISFENITQNLKSLINHEILKSATNIKKNHNFAHGILLQIFNVLCNYLKIRGEIRLINENFEGFIEEINKEMLLKIFILKEIKCPTVISIYVELIRKLQDCLSKYYKKIIKFKFYY